MFQLGSGTGAEVLFKGNCSMAWQIGKGDIADKYKIEGVPTKYKQAYEEYQDVMQQAKNYPPGKTRNAVYINAVKLFFIEQPREAVLLLLRKALLYWFPYSEPVTRHVLNNNVTKILQITTFTPIFLLAVVGVYLQRNRITPLIPIYIIILSQWLTYSVFIVAARYRFNIDAFLILLATPTVTAIGKKIVKLKHRLILS
jgi:NADH:ubiquinone oxidoreductase subunit K